MVYGRGTIYDPTYLNCTKHGSSDVRPNSPSVSIGLFVYTLIFKTFLGVLFTVSRHYLSSSPLDKLIPSVSSGEGRTVDSTFDSPFFFGR